MSNTTTTFLNVLYLINNDGYELYMIRNKMRKLDFSDNFIFNYL